MGRGGILSYPWGRVEDQKYQGSCTKFYSIDQTMYATYKECTEMLKGREINALTDR
jgi:hypothetical protein